VVVDSDVVHVPAVCRRAVAWQPVRQRDITSLAGATRARAAGRIHPRPWPGIWRAVAIAPHYRASRRHAAGQRMCAAKASDVRICRSDAPSTNLFLRLSF
jgi:hypothetical protein